MVAISCYLLLFFLHQKRSQTPRNTDIAAEWNHMLRNLDTLKGRGGFAQPGSFNDPDFLEVDIGAFSFDGSQQSLDENTAHFTLWCITSSPLILGFE
eukprot:m.157890 g.157890  ORF g.157890 m.157890 type:complete len:97 (-) comp20867_c0_seq3:51-341(-)